MVMMMVMIVMMPGQAPSLRLKEWMTSNFTAAAMLHVGAAYNSGNRPLEPRNNLKPPRADRCQNRAFLHEEGETAVRFSCAERASTHVLDDLFVIREVLREHGKRRDHLLLLLGQTKKEEHKAHGRAGEHTKHRRVKRA